MFPLFAAAGDFLPTAITDEIGTQITAIKTDMSSFITTNMTALFSLVGLFVAISLIWFVVRFFKRASKSA